MRSMARKSTWAEDALDRMWWAFMGFGAGVLAILAVVVQR